MSGSTQAGTPVSQLPQAAQTSTTDLLLVLQITSTNPTVYTPRLLPLSVLQGALAMTSEQFAALLATALASLPASLPSVPGQPWNDGGAVSIS